MTSVRQVASRPRRAWSDRRKLTVFLILSYAASWWLWPMVLLNPMSIAMLPIGPTIAAILVTAIAGRRGELRELLGRLVRWRVHPIWYAVALLLPVALFGVPVLVLLSFGVPAEVTGPFPWASLPLLFAVRSIMGGPLGEELGRPTSARSCSSCSGCWPPPSCTPGSTSGPAAACFSSRCSTAPSTRLRRC